jgi:hypothetical protein
MFTRVQAQTISGSPVAIGRSTSSLHRWIQSRAGGHAAHVENDGASTVGPARTIQSYFTTSKRLKDATIIQSFNHFSMLSSSKLFQAMDVPGIKILTVFLNLFLFVLPQVFQLHTVQYNQQPSCNDEKKIVRAMQSSSTVIFMLHNFNPSPNTLMHHVVRKPCHTGYLNTVQHTDLDFFRLPTTNISTWNRFNWCTVWSRGTTSNWHNINFDSLLSPMKTPTMCGIWFPHRRAMHAVVATPGQSEVEETTPTT